MNQSQACTDSRRNSGKTTQQNFPLQKVSTIHFHLEADLNASLKADNTAFKTLVIRTRTQKLILFQMALPIE
jgi:hypothetical protein